MLHKIELSMNFGSLPALKKSRESTSQLFYGSYASLFYFLQIKLHRFEIPGLAWEVQAAVHQGAAASYQFAVYFVHGIRFQPLTGMWIDGPLGCARICMPCTRASL